MAATGKRVKKKAIKAAKSFDAGEKPVLAAKSKSKSKPMSKSKPKSKPQKTSRTVTPEIVEPEIVENDSGTGAAAPDFDGGGGESDNSTALIPSDPLARYLSEIRRYPLLTREQERELAIRYRETGDPKAAEVLVTSNLRFVVKVAAEYTKFGAKLIDLIQEGNVGLMHAVKEFNPYKGVRIITYAVWWIRGYIQEYLMRQYSMVRIGTTATQRKLFYQLQKQRQELERLGRDQAIGLLSDKLGVEPEEIEEMRQRLSARDVSLDKPLSDSQESTLLTMQRTPEEESVDERLGTLEEIQLLRERIEVLRPQLNEREKVILDERLLADEPLTLQEIGEKYHITREAVRQIEQRLMEKLRTQLEGK
jgi:RNA polymerase sigma-32 factor